MIYVLLLVTRAWCQEKQISFGFWDFSDAKAQSKVTKHFKGKGKVGACVFHLVQATNEKSGESVLELG